MNGLSDNQAMLQLFPKQDCEKKILFDDNSFVVLK